MNPSKPFIQSVYCCRVFTPASGSACAEKVASGWQYALHPSHPFPVSHASKNFLAIPVIGIMGFPFLRWIEAASRRVYAEGTNAVDQPDLRARPDPGRGPPPPRKSGP